MTRRMTGPGGSSMQAHWAHCQAWESGVWAGAPCRQTGPTATRGKAESERAQPECMWPGSLRCHEDGRTALEGTGGLRGGPQRYRIVRAVARGVSEVEGAR